MSNLQKMNPKDDHVLKLQESSPISARNINSDYTSFSSYVYTIPNVCTDASIHIQYMTFWYRRKIICMELTLAAHAQSSGTLRLRPYKVILLVKKWRERIPSNSWLLVKKLCWLQSFNSKVSKERQLANLGSIILMILLFQLKIQFLLLILFFFF